MTENKRFWYDFEDCDGAKMVDFKKDKEYPLETIGDFRGIEELLNSLNDENEQLKKELEDWKSNCLSTINENSILWNEIAIMREQGAKPSSAFEEYCSKFKGDVE